MMKDCAWGCSCGRGAGGRGVGGGVLRQFGVGCSCCCYCVVIVVQGHSTGWGRVPAVPWLPSASSPLPPSLLAPPPRLHPTPGSLTTPTPSTATRSRKKRTDSKAQSVAITFNDVAGVDSAKVGAEGGELRLF